MTGIETRERIREMKNKFPFLTKKYFTKIHKRSRKRIYDALNDEAPELLVKINNHLDKLENKL